MQRSVYRGLEGAGKKSPLKLLAELGRKEILLKITHASLCGTSTFLRQEWHSAARELELLRRLEVASPSSQSEIVLVQATLEMQVVAFTRTWWNYLLTIRIIELRPLQVLLKRRRCVLL